MSGCSSPVFLGYGFKCLYFQAHLLGVFGGTNDFITQVGPSSGTFSPLYEFVNNGNLPGDISYSGQTVCKKAIPKCVT